jgi:hypothetical protein
VTTRQGFALTTAQHKEVRMFNATNYALRRDVDLVAIGSEIAGDLIRGGLVFCKLVVVLAGCATLLVGGTLAVSGDARGRLIERVIEIATALPAAAIDVADRVSGSPRSVLGAIEGLAVVPSQESLEPQQKHVTQYLARRYRVADEAVRLIVVSAFDTGRSLGLDPLLILAVTAVESSMNPFAESAMGAQGLMQVMTRVHADKFEAHGGDHAALDPIANLKVGSLILKDLVRRGGSVERGLQLYVGAGNLQDDTGYAARVMAEHGRLSIAAAGRVERALAAGRAPSSSVESKSVRSEPSVAAPATPETLGPTPVETDGSTAANAT